MHKIDKIELLRAVVNGDRETVVRMKDQYNQKLQGKIIFAEFHTDGTVCVIAPCLNWIGDKARVMNPDEYVALIEKYNFQPLEIEVN